MLKDKHFATMLMDSAGKEFGRGTVDMALLCSIVPGGSVEMIRWQGGPTSKMSSLLICLLGGLRWLKDECLMWPFQHEGLSWQLRGGSPLQEQVSYELEKLRG